MADEPVDQGATTTRLLAALTDYRGGRAAFLEALGCPTSNRDPFAEFSERLVAAWLGGTLAASRVQKGYDLTTPEGKTVQVRYLANPAGRWVNEHHVSFDDELELYALALFEAFELTAVIAFPRETLGAVCARLGKRHPNQGRTLQLTRANYRRLLSEREEFEHLGVRFLMPTAGEPV